MSIKKAPCRNHCRKIDWSKPLWNWARATTCEDESRLGGADLMVEVHDSVGQPHFHFLRANGDNIPISMLRPEYIEPTRHKLTARERDAMLELFVGKESSLILLGCGTIKIWIAIAVSRKLQMISVHS